MSLEDTIIILSSLCSLSAFIESGDSELLLGSEVVLRITSELDDAKVKINNVVTTDYTVDTLATPLPKITLTNATSESKLLSGNGID